MCVCVCLQYMFTFCSVWSCYPLLPTEAALFLLYEKLSKNKEQNKRWRIAGDGLGGNWDQEIEKRGKNGEE